MTWRFRTAKQAQADEAASYLADYSPIQRGLASSLLMVMFTIYRERLRSKAESVRDENNLPNLAQAQQTMSSSCISIGQRGAALETNKGFPS
jgi:hypothetical protein